MKNLDTLDLIKKTISKSLLYTIREAKIEGSVVDVKTFEGDDFSVLVFERPIKERHEPSFSISANAIEECEACGYRYIVNIYGRNKECTIVAVDTPNIESYDEFGELVYTYRNPLCYE